MRANVEHAARIIIRAIVIFNFFFHFLIRFVILTIRKTSGDGACAIDNIYTIKPWGICVSF